MKHCGEPITDPKMEAMSRAIDFKDYLESTWEVLGMKDDRRLAELFSRFSRLLRTSGVALYGRLQTSRANGALRAFSACHIQSASLDLRTEGVWLPGWQGLHWRWSQRLRLPQIAKRAALC